MILFKKEKKITDPGIFNTLFTVRVRVPQLTKDNARAANMIVRMIRFFMRRGGYKSTFPYRWKGWIWHPETASFPRKMH